VDRHDYAVLRIGLYGWMEMLSMGGEVERIGADMYTSPALARRQDSCSRCKKLRDLLAMVHYNYPRIEYPCPVFFRDTSIMRNLNFAIQQVTIMQVCINEKYCEIVYNECCDLKI
jgi:hypothetical protein